MNKLQLTEAALEAALEAAKTYIDAASSNDPTPHNISRLKLRYCEALAALDAVKEENPDTITLPRDLVTTKFVYIGTNLERCKSDVITLEAKVATYMDGVSKAPSRDGVCDEVNQALHHVRCALDGIERMFNQLKLALDGKL